MKKSRLITTLIFSLSILFAYSSENYYFSKKVTGSYNEVVLNTKAALKTQGFGVLTEIQMDKKLSETLDNVKLKPYLILGVCNPSLAYQSVQAEENVGLFLPCKVLVKQLNDTESEVVFVNPSAMMQHIGNTQLDLIANEVTERLRMVLNEL